MSPNQNARSILVLLGILWAGSVTLFYLLNNTGYYEEKVSVFWDFIIKQLGMN